MCITFYSILAYILIYGNLASTAIPFDVRRIIRVIGLDCFFSCLCFMLFNVISELTTEWVICISELLREHIITIDFDYFNSHSPQAGPEAVPHYSKSCFLPFGE